MKIFIFGDFNQVRMPLEFEAYVNKVVTVMGDKIEFIVGDNRGLDSRINNILSKIGAGEKTTVYGVNKVSSNDYGFKEEIIEVSEEEAEGTDFTTIKFGKLIDDCDAAIVLWDGESKSTFNRINKLKIRNKDVKIIRL